MIPLSKNAARSIVTAAKEIRMPGTPAPLQLPASETPVKVKGVRGKRPHGWDTADGFGKEFEPVLAHGPDAYTAQGDLNVWTVWKKGVGVTFVIDADAGREFTLEEAIEYRDALTSVISKVEKAVKK